MSKNIDKKLWGVLGKQQTYYSPQQFLKGKTKVPLNANPFDSWDVKRSRFNRVDGYENAVQQGGVVPQDTTPVVSPTPSSTPQPTPSFTPSATPTYTPTETPTSTPTPSATPCSINQLYLQIWNDSATSIGVEPYSAATSITDSLSYAYPPCPFDFSIQLYLDNGTNVAYTNTFPANSGYTAFDVSSVLGGNSYTGYSWNSATFTGTCDCFGLIPMNYYYAVNCNNPSDVRDAIVPDDWNNTTRKQDTGNVCWSISGQTYAGSPANFYPNAFTSTSFSGCSDCDVWNEATINWNSETTNWENA